MFSDWTVWRRHPWSVYATFQTTLTNWPIFFDPLLSWLLFHITADLPQTQKWTVRVLYLVWQYFVSRLIKYAGHFVRYPEDMVYIPAILFFGQLHCLIKLKALWTLNETAWGSREGADVDDSDRMIPLPSPSAPEKTPLLDESPARKRNSSPTLTHNDLDDEKTAFRVA
ncbi:hypothetical protein LTS18_011477 [Coniosporium uncinatum]|uniref:Uncharacterized protein n=1 Tax=Coniosporium uncinatum TaxID=93489 RepID=A0ACC3D9R1_9PEZI|nr:hypothetical protein LTS18_011477 [Coniosporium uncinatum]